MWIFCKTSFLNVFSSFTFFVVASIPSVAAPAVTLRASFTGANGARPGSELIAAGGSLFYGTTSEGGINNKGGVFEFNSNTNSITFLDSFTGANGSRPGAALTAAGGGLYYGTTISGGADNIGGVFQFNSVTGSITLKGSFTGASFYANPYSRLTAAGSGLYYGTTTNGGVNAFGSVFEFNSNTNSITILSSFTGANGRAPYAALTAAGGGLYYGTTYTGGANNVGGVYEFNSNTNSITLLDSFTGANGAFPYAALTAAGGGLYYGTTYFGGANLAGTVFEFNSNTGLITLLDSFTGPNGANPFAALTAVGDGLYYGTTVSGGDSSFGGIFEFNSITNSITLLDSFTGVNGMNPNASLTAAGENLYFSTTFNGGAQDYGAIYAFNTRATSVPGPLPFMGAGAAFGWSRQLRRRVRQAQSVTGKIAVSRPT